MDLSVNRTIKQEYLHIPNGYIPECKNFHPEKEIIHRRLKSNTHYQKYNFQKSMETFKINPDNYIKTFIGKKKTKEIISTYSLNEKLKLQRRLSQKQKNWQEAQKKKHQNNEEVDNINKEESKRSTITKTGIRIYGMDKFHQCKIKSIFSSSPLNNNNIPSQKISNLNKRKGKHSKQLSLPPILSEPNLKTERDINLRSLKTLQEDIEFLSPKNWGEYKYDEIQNEMKTYEIIEKIDVFNLMRNKLESKPIKNVVLNRAQNLIEKKSSVFEKNETILKKLEKSITNGFKENYFKGIPHENPKVEEESEENNKEEQEIEIKKEITTKNLDSRNIISFLASSCKMEHKNHKKLKKEFKRQNFGLQNKFLKIKSKINEVLYAFN